MFSSTRLLNIYFFGLISIIPISILVGSTISLINIILISVSFIIVFFFEKNYFILSNKIILLLLITYCYLIFNSLISIDFSESAPRSFGFLRFILLFIAINFLFFKYESLNNIFKVWLIVIFVVLFDVIYEFSTGENILGFVSENKKRVVSFFKNEAVVGSFINGFFFILIGFCFQNYDDKKKAWKILTIFFIILAAISMIFSGERANTIKFFIGLIIFFYLNDKINLKYKLLFLFLIMAIFFTAYSQVKEIKHRYKNDLIEKILHKDKNLYFHIYRSGFEVFKKYPIFGTGNKNYRTETCTNFKEKGKRTINKYICITHPHQIYLEFLSEHGIFGTLFLLLILFYLIFKNYKIMLLKKNYIQIGSFIYLLITFVPLIPAGSFFADFNATFFWINFSIYYACDFKTNIYKKLNS
jgi:O-antigen ligase